MRDIAFTAVSKAVPKRIVTNDQLSQFMDTSDAWISRRTGIKRRHVSGNENTSALATQVAKQLLTKVNWSAADLDLIIVDTMSPDSLTPSTAAIVQGKIGAANAVAFDISAACSGFAYAVSIARALLIANHWQKAMVIGAEVLSKIVDWHDRSTAVLFGDGAGGAILESSEQQHLLAQDLNTFGQWGDKLTAGQIFPRGDYLANQHHFTAFKMAGRDVYRFATHQVPASITRASRKAQVSLDQIDYFLLHQANSRIIEQVARRLKQPLTKFPMNIAEYGNTAGASEAILLAEAVEKKVVKRGEIIALSGFGGGLTTATLIFKF